MSLSFFSLLTPLLQSSFPFPLPPFFPILLFPIQVLLTFFSALSSNVMEWNLI